MPRHTHPPVLTDRQRLLQTSPQRTPPTTDRQQLLTSATARPAHKPLVVGSSTFIIRGKDGTYISLDFGFGRLARQINLYDYLPAHYVPHLSNLVFDLTGVLPDAIGLDIGIAGGFEINNPFSSKSSGGGVGLSGVGGINILWHSRGDLQAGWPEIHWYHGYGATASKGSIVTTLSNLLSPVSLSGAAQLILAWARRYDKNGVPHPSTNRWVANGYNWTGTFWSSGFSIPVYGKFSLVCSYFKSVESLDGKKDIDIWRGVSIGVGVSAKLTIKTGLKWDNVARIKLKDLASLKDIVNSIGVNQSVTHYGLWYGNGGDYLPDANGKPKRSLDGFNWPTINQDEDK